MADDERTPGVTPSDAFVAQQRDVEAAIAALERSLGGRGATFLKHVRTWADSLDHTASKLKTFPPGLRGAGDRLPASPPDLRAARDEFTRAIGRVRDLYRTGDHHEAPAAFVRPVPRGWTLCAQVRACSGSHGRRPHRPPRARAVLCTCVAAWAVTVRCGAAVRSVGALAVLLFARARVPVEFERPAGRHWRVGSRGGLSRS